MSIYRKIIAVLLSIAITFSLIAIPAVAAVDLFEPFTKVVVVPFSDFVVDVLHAGDKIYDSLTEIQRENFKETVGFWSSFFGPDSTADAYDAYVSTLDSPTASYSLSTTGYSATAVGSSKSSELSGYSILLSVDRSAAVSLLHNLGVNKSACITVVGEDVIGGLFFDSSGRLCMGRFVNPVGYLNASLFGVYDIANLELYRSDYVMVSLGNHLYSYPIFYDKFYAEQYPSFLTSTVLAIDWPSTASLSSSASLSFRFYHKSSSNTVWSDSLAGSSSNRVSYSLSGSISFCSAPLASTVVFGVGHNIVQPSGTTSSTRPVSLMQSINNYNEDNSYTDNSETVNYYIGTLDAGGDVTNIYNVNLYDEETLIFTEPVTGAQYQTTGWTYDYTTRCYTLDLSSGTFTLDGSDIDKVKLTYGDDLLTLDYYSGSTLVESDEYAYVRVAQSECALNGHTYTYETVQEATCTTPGERKYTCSVCGNQYAEEIPKTDHAYTYTTQQEPTCTADGIGLYTCSVCGDQHTEPIAALGHDWLATEVTDTTYNLPPGTSCPDCGSTDFTHELDKNGGVFGCTCSACGAEWVTEAEITYGHTEYTCSRCGETYIESEDPESGLFASIGNFVANGIGWVTDKLSDLINSISGINDIFSGFVERIKEKAGDYPAFLGAVIAVLPEDLTLVFWFAVIAAIVLAVWKKWFH